MKYVDEYRDAAAARKLADAVARTVAVDAQGLLEGLRKVYNAEALVEEIAPKK